MLVNAEMSLTQYIRQQHPMRQWLPWPSVVMKQTKAAWEIRVRQLFTSTTYWSLNSLKFKQLLYMAPKTCVAFVRLLFVFFARCF